MIDLYVLKKHPRLIQKYNISSTLPATMVKERMNLWKKSSQQILPLFIKEFGTSKTWESNLSALMRIRDIIAHGKISLNQEYVLYRPSGGRAKIAKLNKDLEPLKKKDQSKVYTLLLRLGNDLVYNKILQSIKEIDEVYLKKEADLLKIDYNTLR